MKIRIKGNSVRLRLTKSEVEEITKTGYLEERTSFGKNTFVYTLQSKSDIDKMSADFEDGKITLYIPESFIKDWSVNDIISFESKMKTGNGEQLYLLVEKDFKCLDETTEDQSDNYENPNKFC